MRFELSADSCVFVDLRATGLLKAVGHDPTLSVHPQATSVEVGDDGDGKVNLVFRISDIEVPPDLSESDRQKMLDNMRGAEVLDAGRFPTIEFRGRYEGTVEGGELRGDLVVRGQPRPLSASVKATRQWDVLVAAGSWEGTLTDLGIKPFKALLGALKLKDWVRLRFEGRLKTSSTP
jgi:hypothetical protein